MIGIGRGVVVTIACGLSPRRSPNSRLSLVAPRLVKLRAAQLVRRIAREQNPERAVRPRQSSSRRLVRRHEPRRRDRQNPGLALQHDVAHVGRRLPDDREPLRFSVLRRLRPFADRLRTGLRLPHPAPAEQHPHVPIRMAGLRDRRHLIRPRPRVPIVQQRERFFRAHVREQLLALFGRQLAQLLRPTRRFEQLARHSVVSASLSASIRRFLISASFLSSSDRAFSVVAADGDSVIDMLSVGFPSASCSIFVPMSAIRTI
jgi:hypothetical protein